jgi:predicted ATPase
MIESIEFNNFKVLRNAVLPLGRLNLLIGPNGSGKSTVLQALRLVAGTEKIANDRIFSVGASQGQPLASTVIRWGAPWAGHTSELTFRGAKRSERITHEQSLVLRSFRCYALHPDAIAKPVTLAPKEQLGPDGANLAGVLDRLRDQQPERFEALDGELARWIPEFDRILFETPAAGQRAFLLRTKGSQRAIHAVDLSQGTLLALALLTLAYLPEPPPLIGLEEPDRGLHPRLMRDVRDAMYRLAYPEQHGESRPPVQVIATTHSPYLVDLFRDHPEEIIIANKHGTEATFERLSDRPDFEKVLEDASLGEAWYTGILGGVPVQR